MTLDVIRTREALVDVIEITYSIDQSGRPAAAQRFVTAVQDAYKQLAEFPGMGALRDYGNPANVGMRMWPVPGFRNYLIFYRVVGSQLRILHVLHGARDLDAFFAPPQE